MNSECLVVIPTVDGRESHLLKCVEAYTGHAITIVRDKTTCGEAWNLGANMAIEQGFKYVHMTADDLIPHPGWYECAVETTNSGYFLPCARVMLPDGSCQVHGVWGNEVADGTVVRGASVPFCRTEDWIDIPNIHYFSDNAFDSAQTIVNNKIFLARTNYAFTHHMAQPGRKGPARDEERQTWIEWEKTL